MTDPSLAPSPPVVNSTFVTVLAWLGIILFGASFALFGAESLLFRSIFESGTLWQMPADSLAPRMTPEAMKAGIGMMRYVSLGLLVYLALGMGASVGLLHRRNWARVTIIGFLALNIAWALFGLVGAFLLGNVPPSTPPPGFPSSPQFGEMLRAMRMFMSALAIAAALISGWLIKRLASKPIRAEFTPRVA